MNTGAKTWPRVAAASIIAVAIAVAWALVLLWAAYLAIQLFGRNDWIYESMQVMDDGTPVIQTTTSRPVYDTTFRTLDRKPILIGQREWLAAGFFQKPPAPPGVIEQPVVWTARVARDSNFQRPLVTWYVIRDEKPIGHAYLVGYDELSKLPVGYLGRVGFRRAIPPMDEWFELGRRTLDWSGRGVFSSGESRIGQSPEIADVQDQRVPPWLVFLIDGTRLLEVDLRARSVRALMESPDMIAGSLVSEPPLPRSKVTTEPAGATVTESAHESAIPRLMIRKTDRIIVLDRPTGAKREFVLPQQLRPIAFNVYVVGGDQLLIWWADERSEDELMWIRKDGTVARHETLVLARPTQPTAKEGFWLAAGVVPVPIGWLTALGAAPVAMLQSNESASYGEGVAKFLELGCLPFVAVMLLGALAAWLTLRQQRKYRRSATSVWATFVFLFGLPGFLAYLVEHRRAKLEACPQCGEIVPRDRHSCAACNVEFAPPPLVGTEILA